MRTSTATAEVDWRSVPRPPAPRPAPDGWVVGVAGGPDPGGALRDAGLEPAYHADRVALAGSVARTGSVVVSGRAASHRARPLDPAGRSPTDARAQIGAAWTRAGPAAVMEEPAVYGVVVHDESTGRTHLARDPLGERTIYYTQPDTAGRTWFADRLGTLRRIGAVGPALNLESLRDYLVFAYVPGTNTMYAGGFEVGPGTTVEVGGRAPAACRWWSLLEHADDRDLDANAVWLRSLLERAVDDRRPPGPVGVYLSGGVDSSAVTALLCRSAPHEVHTFAVHFGPDLPNELPFVDRVVAHVGPGHHHEIELTAGELSAALPDTMAALDDPIGDPLTVPNFALGRRAADVVGTVYNGEGGDPVFGGPKNQPMLLAALYGAGTRGSDLDELYLRSYQKCYADLGRLLRPEVADALADAPPATIHVTPYLSEGEMTQFLNRLFEANTRLKGCDHILTKVGNLTAAAGLLARSPLFDRRIVEAAFAMTPAHKLDGTVEKAVLKAAVADLLPATIIDRPKAGMRVPVQTWFRGPLRREGAKRLLSRRARIAPYLDRAAIKDWTRYDGDPSGRYGRKLWLLLSLEHWLEAHGAG